MPELVILMFIIWEEIDSTLILATIRLEVLNIGHSQAEESDLEECD